MAMEMPNPSNPRVSIKFLISNSMAGLLIGSGGKSIKELIAITNARINVSGSTEFYPGTSERVVLIVGNLDTVLKAQMLIWQMIAIVANAGATDSASVEWSPQQAMNSLGSLDSVETQGKITIPASAGGLILGKGGSNIRQFAEDSGARLLMSTKEEAMFTQERVLTVIGLTAQCVACVAMVVSKLANEEEVAQFANRGTSYTSLLNPGFGAGYGGQQAGGFYGGRGGGRRGGPHDAAAHDPNAGMMMMGMMPQTDQFGMPMGGGVGMVGGQMAAQPVGTTITIDIPDDLIGNIFGKQGATMREIISLSGAKVTVSPRGEYKDGSNLRTVTISGSPTCAQTAHLYITQRLQMPANPNKRSRAMEG